MLCKEVMIEHVLVRMTARALFFVFGFGIMIGKVMAVGPPSQRWKAAASELKITPAEPMWMAGYASRSKPSDGAIQDLYAKTLALEDGQGARLIVITLDLIGIPADMRLSLEQAIATKHGLKPENLFVNASHTHSGPEFRLGAWRYLEGMEHKVAEAQRYGGWLRDQLVSQIDVVLAGLAPASVNYTHARCGFAMNRRNVSRLGISNSPNPSGPVDHDVPVLEVTAAGAKVPLAIVFGYACHATTLALQQFCGDYPGFAQASLQKTYPGAVAMFVNGCSGDQNPYPRRELHYAETHGKTLATAVESALQVNPKLSIVGPLKLGYELVPLAFETPPTKDALTKQAGGQGYLAQHAQRLLAIIEHEGALPTTYPYPVQVIQFGDQLGLVTLGGEVVVDYSLRLKQELKLPNVWVAGYSNDVMGYIPSLRVLKEGGYEGGGAMVYGSHPGPWSPEVETTIVGKVMEMQRKLSAR
jgi:neutral ceramidase